MTSAEVHERIADLRAQVARHDELYHRQAKPEVTDFEYDLLKSELAGLEAKYPQFKAADSPTTRVGDDRLEGFATYRHRLPMQSLDNTYSEADLRAFAGLQSSAGSTLVHADLKAVNTKETPANVAPQALDGVSMEGGRLAVTLPPALALLALMASGRCWSEML